MLGVCKQDNVTVHGGQMRPRSCRRTRRKHNAVFPSQSRGRQAHSCRRQFLQATSAQFTSDSAAHHGETGMTSHVDRGVGNGAITTTLFACSEKGRFRIRLGLKRKSTSLRRIALRRAPCCKLMWAYQPRSTRQNASLCAKEPPHTNLRRPSVRWSLPSQSSCRRVRQSTLFEHPQPWSIHRASQCLVSFDDMMSFLARAFSWFLFFVFTTCSPRVHHVFTTCSPRVHHVFTTYSPRIHHVFTTCSPRVHHVFTTCSPRVHHVFTTCSPRVHHVSTTCSPRVSTYSPRVYHMFTTCSPRVHHVFTTCPPRVHHVSAHIHHVFTTC